MPKDARAEVVYDGYRARLSVLFHSNIQPERCVAGEIHAADGQLDGRDQPVAVERESGVEPERPGEAAIVPAGVGAAGVRAAALSALMADLRGAYGEKALTPERRAT